MSFGYSTEGKVIGSGISTYVHSMARALKKLGHEVHVIFPSTLMSTYEDNGVFIHRIKYDPFFSAIVKKHFAGLYSAEDRFIYSIHAYKEICRIVKDHGINIVEAPDWYAGALTLSLFKPIPLVVRGHTPLSLISSLEKHKSPFSLVAGSFEETSVKHSSALISTSYALAQYYRNRCLRTNAYIVHNGVDLKVLRDNNRISFKSLQQLEPYRLVLYVGGLHRIKGFHVLAKAANKILENNFDLRIVFVGEYDYVSKQEVLKEINKKNKGRIIFTGPLPYEYTISAIRECDILVVPSLWESCSYVALEGMAYGKAIVASKVGGMDELITDRKNGLLFTCGFSEVLAEKVELLLSNDKLRRNLGDAARLLIETSFTSEIMARKTLQIYNKLIT